MNAPTNVSKPRLRTLGMRAIRVHERLKDVHPAIDACAPELVTAAEGYIEAFNAAASFQATRTADLAEGRQRIDELYGYVQAWLAVLARDIEGFDRGQFEGRPDAPDQLIGEAGRLLELLERQGEALPYASTLLDGLRAALQSAEQEWAQAQEALVTQQQLQAKVRERGARLHRELIAFRRTLRAVVGSSHRDYQMLRASRVSSVVEDEETEQTDEVETVTQPSPTNGASHEAPAQLAHA